MFFFFFFQAEDGIRDHCVTGVQTCALLLLSFSSALRLRYLRLPSFRTCCSHLNCSIYRDCSRISLSRVILVASSAVSTSAYLHLQLFTGTWLLRINICSVNVCLLDIPADPLFVSVKVKYINTGMQLWAQRKGKLLVLLWFPCDPVPHVGLLIDMNSCNICGFFTAYSSGAKSKTGTFWKVEKIYWHYRQSLLELTKATNLLYTEHSEAQITSWCFTY